MDKQEATALIAELEAWKPWYPRPSIINPENPDSRKQIDEQAATERADKLSNLEFADRVQSFAQRNADQYPDLNGKLLSFARQIRKHVEECKRERRDKLNALVDDLIPMLQGITARDFATLEKRIGQFIADAELLRERLGVSNCECRGFEFIGEGSPYTDPEAEKKHRIHREELKIVYDQVRQTAKTIAAELAPKHAAESEMVFALEAAIRDRGKYSTWADTVIPKLRRVAAQSPDKKRKPAEECVRHYIKQRIEDGATIHDITRDGIAQDTGLAGGTVSGTNAYKRLAAQKKADKPKGRAASLDHHAEQGDWAAVERLQDAEMRLNPRADN